MNDLNNEAFTGLFKEACLKCFGNPLLNPLSETESKQLANKIFEDTGLVIGAKSIKNYSSYVLNGAEGKPENPSIATLDTLARYVLNAPYTDEVQRKAKESHHPYWFEFRNRLTSVPKAPLQLKKARIKRIFLIAVINAIVMTVFLAGLFLFRKSAGTDITEDFHSVLDDSLKQHGWLVKSKDDYWWKRRGENASALTLFTLRGDSWPDSVNSPVIKNLLWRKIDAECFTTEIHISKFIPLRNWQQAGIILMEDTSFTGRSVRLSIAYNDFFGGYSKPKEIIIQGVSSGGNHLEKPEEIAHLPVFSVEPGQESLVYNNLQNEALRIEKSGSHFRFLYSAGPLVNFAFKEAFSKDLPIKPKYIGIFALEGFVSDTNYTPVHVSFFNFLGMPCEK